MRHTQLRFLCLVILWLSGLAALPFLPNPAPIHWNAAGEVDGYGSPLIAALLTPAITTALVALIPLLPRIDPLGKRYVAFAGTYERLMSALVVFLTGVQLVTLAAIFGLPIATTTLITVGTGLLLMLIGAELGRVTPNYFVGIRTPWTLADPEVWRRTHQVGGRAFIAAGAVVALAPLLLPPGAAVTVTMLGVVGLVVFVIGYSYWLWSRSQKRAP